MKGVVSSQFWFSDEKPGKNNAEAREQAEKENGKKAHAQQRVWGTLRVT
jgi:hypothetical protein